MNLGFLVNCISSHQLETVTAGTFSKWTDLYTWVFIAMWYWIQSARESLASIFEDREKRGGLWYVSTLSLQFTVSCTSRKHCTVGKWKLEVKESMHRKTSFSCHALDRHRCELCSWENLGRTSKHEYLKLDPKVLRIFYLHGLRSFDWVFQADHPLSNSNSQTVARTLIARSYCWWFRNPASTSWDWYCSLSQFVPLSTGFYKSQVQDFWTLNSICGTISPPQTSASSDSRNRSTNMWTNLTGVFCKGGETEKINIRNLEDVARG